MLIANHAGTPFMTLFVDCTATEFTPIQAHTKEENEQSYSLCEDEAHLFVEYFVNESKLESETLLIF